MTHILNTNIYIYIIKTPNLTINLFDAMLSYDIKNYRNYKLLTIHTTNVSTYRPEYLNIDEYL